MKFKVGDKVFVKEDNASYGKCFVIEVKYDCCLVYYKERISGTYKKRWFKENELYFCKNEKEGNKMKFKIGDKVLCDNKHYTVVGVCKEEHLLIDNDGYKRLGNGEKLTKYKPTIDDLRDYMLEHFVDVFGYLDIGGLDFSEFDGSVVISGMKVKGDLYQIGHKVERHLYQSEHNVKGNLSQSEHKVKGDLSQSWHEVQGDLYQSKHKVKGDYHCEGIKYGGNAYVDEPQKTLKEITKEELVKMGYKLKGEN